jgi:DnaK suppressor protein
MRIGSGRDWFQNQFIRMKAQSIEDKREEGLMTQNELNRFRAILTAKVAELERFTRHREGIAVERSADQLEEIQAASERALAVCNLDREFYLLRNVRAAVRRIQEGSFGTSQECDQDIHPKRLAAVPWTSFCIRCQEAVDRNLEETKAPTRDLLRAA